MARLSNIRGHHRQTAAEQTYFRERRKTVRAEREAHRWRTGDVIQTGQGRAKIVNVHWNGKVAGYTIEDETGYRRILQQDLEALQEDRKRVDHHRQKFRDTRPAVLSPKTRRNREQVEVKHHGTLPKALWPLPDFIAVSPGVWFPVMVTGSQYIH